MKIQQFLWRLQFNGGQTKPDNLSQEQTPSLYLDVTQTITQNRSNGFYLLQISPPHIVQFFSKAVYVTATLI